MFWDSMSGSRHSVEEALSSVADKRCLTKVYGRRMVEGLETCHRSENSQQKIHSVLIYNTELAVYICHHPISN